MSNSEAQEESPTTQLKNMESLLRLGLPAEIIAELSAAQQGAAAGTKKVQKPSRDL